VWRLFGALSITSPSPDEPADFSLALRLIVMYCLASIEDLNQPFDRARRVFDLNKLLTCLFTASAAWKDESSAVRS
jgi:hypothetical protein